ncbi:MAG: phage holin family protein [Chitinophagaceae bacterium]|nr:phage holin family protein [Chitinophagaceae bacterium]
MSKAWTDLIQHLGYRDNGALAESLAPSLKYPDLFPSLFVFILANLSVPLTKIFGLNELALIALGVTFCLEFASGIWAAKCRGEKIVSSKVTRFILKLALYLNVIAVFWLLHISFEEQGREVGSIVFDYLHLLSVFEIIYENWISIRENAGEINEKSDWLVRLRDKFTNKLG